MNVQTMLTVLLTACLALFGAACGGSDEGEGEVADTEVETGGEDMDDLMDEAAEEDDDSADLEDDSLEETTDDAMDAVDNMGDEDIE